MATNENMDTTAVAGNEDERKLFAGGFPENTTEAQIKEHFGQFGEIETVTLKTNMATGCFSSMVKLARVMSRAGWASLAALAAILPEPVSAKDDPVANVIR